MIDIVLAQTPPWGLFAPPLGIAYLSAYLKAKGLAVQIFDINAALCNMAHDKSLWDFERKDEWNNVDCFRGIKEAMDKKIDYCVKKILCAEPVAVGLSVNQNSLLFSLELSRRIKESRDDVAIIAGGWGCYNAHERAILQRGGLIDFFVIGEGEESLFELLSCLKEKKEKLNVRGVLRNNHGNHDFSLRPPVEDLDGLPFPTYGEFNLDDYKSPVLSLLSTRGCIGRCVFCNDRVYQGKIRYRDPGLIVEEIQYHMDNNRIRDFSFSDLLINGDLAHLDLWCSLVIKKKLGIRWLAQALARPDMRQGLFYKMREAGCDTLQFGIESGSDRVLRKMGKMFNVSCAQNVLGLACKAGIRTWINFIVGFPGEQEEDFEETVNFIKRNRKNIDRVGSVNTCNVVFNSGLMENRGDYGVILSDNPEFIELSWRTQDGNCNALRKYRSEALMAVLRELNMPVGQTNLFVLPSRE